MARGDPVPGYLPKTDGEQTPKRDPLAHGASNATQPSKAPFLVLAACGSVNEHKRGHLWDPYPPPRGLQLTRTWAALKR